MARKILVVDDNKMNRDILRAILGEEYEVLEAEDGREALKILNSKYKSISAVLLDIVMANMDGYEVLSRLNKNPILSQIPVIVTTGSTGEGGEFRALSLGANDYIEKPYNPDIIKQRLKNTIKLRETASIINEYQRDELTGLYNRKIFLKKAEEMIMSKPSGYYVMSCFDIDNFKVINEQYGSEKGDEVLKYIASIFDEGFESIGGISCRIMADTFAILYPKSFINSEELNIMRESVRTVGELIPPIMFSIGRYIVEDSTIPINAMYDRASIAQTTIKGQFGIHIAEYNKEMLEEILQKQEIIKEMDGALKNRNFEVWFQPQYNHINGSLIGAEALVRWRHPEKGLIPPIKFIPVFEQNGFIYELDKFVWEECCILLRRWIDEGKNPLPVSVNVSRHDMFCQDVVEVITGLVKKYNIPLELLKLEITESAFSKSAEQIISVVKELREYGFTMEIDDFGTGYSSLNILKDVPADTLKLDMKFLEAGENSVKGGSILQSIVRMAKWLGMSVIAEGVEILEQADYLKSIGCNYIQGYLYAKPMMVEDYEKLVTNMEKEEWLTLLETGRTFDNNAFWDPKSMDTLIFNSYVGGACIFEYTNGIVEILRVNDKYVQNLHGGNETEFIDVFKFEWNKHVDEENRLLMRKALLKTINTGDEVTEEFMFLDLPGGVEKTYLRASVRAIASAGERHLIYCTNENVTARHEAENKKREATERLKIIMENVNSGITAITLDENYKAKFIFSNEQYYYMQGYTREQFETEIDDIFNIIHVDDRDEVKKIVNVVMENRLPTVFECRVVKRDGGIINIRCNIAITEMEGIGNNVIISVISNITELVKAEEGNIKKAEQLSAIMKNINGGVTAVVIKDGIPKFIYANNQYYKQLGYTKEEFEAEVTDIFELIHPDDRKNVIESTNNGSKIRKPYSINYRIKCRDGNIRWMRSNISIINFKNIEEPVQLAVANDITAQYEAEEKEHKISKQLQIIMENINSGIAAIVSSEKNVEYVFVNNKYYQILGYTEEQYKSEVKEMQDVINSEDIGNVISTIAEVNNTGMAKTVEYRITRRDGTTIWIRTNFSSTMFDEFDEPVVLGILTDITSEKLVEQNLAESNRQLRFINNIAKEILLHKNYNKAIDIILEKTREHFKAERAIIYEFNYSENVCNATYEVCTDKMLFIKESCLGLPIKVFWSWFQHFEKTNFFYEEDLDKLDNTRNEEKTLYKLIGAKSILVISLRSEGKIIGATVIVNPQRYSKDYYDLYVLGEYISNVISKRELTAKVKNNSDVLLKLMNDIPGGFMVVKVHPDRSITGEYANKFFCRMLDITEDDFLNYYKKDIFRGIHPDDRQALQETITSLLDGNEIRKIKYRLRYKNSGYISLLAFGRVIKNEAGEVYINVYCTDMTD